MHVNILILLCSVDMQPLLFITFKVAEKKYITEFTKIDIVLFMLARLLLSEINETYSSTVIV